ncbi:MAG: AtpZ/AtpI family protein [Defluviitaleaceae bacterium]|nr:AtpZ/AtpI family protein [Defluviitaleaceae bacterium]
MKNHGKFSKEDRKKMLRAAGIISNIAFTMVACVFVGIFLGIFLDEWLGTAPWFIIICSLLGCFSAFKAMYDLSKKF